MVLLDAVCNSKRPLTEGKGDQIEVKMLEKTPPLKNIIRLCKCIS
jgi:hypothetical protein